MIKINNNNNNSVIWVTYLYKLANMIDTLRLKSVDCSSLGVATVDHEKGIKLSI